MKKYNETLIKVQEIRDWIIKVRRDFHMNPELSGKEFRTRDKVVEYLKDMGIEHKTGIADTGVLGIIRGKQGGKTVALRADMDALPIQDKKNVVYKSTIDGKMHACGHDAHTSILLGTAKILKGMEEDLHGNVKLFFQPAEETVGGAERMIEDGVMENPGVDAVFGLHVSPEIDVGKIGIKYGQTNAYTDSLEITVYGKDGHAARPHEGIDAIVTASQIVVALQSIVSRNIDPVNSVVVTIGTINGGTRCNIIADRVRLTGTMRTLDPDTRELVIKRIKNIVTQIAEAMGGKAECIIKDGYPALVNTDEIIDIVRDSGEGVLGADNVTILKTPRLGGEDFAYFAKAAPSAFYRLGCGNAEKGIIHGAHTCLFDIDEDCLVFGTALQVQNVLTFLNR
ncbi:MAG: M20 family metallopeptidase [Natronincolaceae bacterium]|jgi:amidohydrolase|nr:M20 family metallopeptidase [Bacillota bacterium]